MAEKLGIAINWMGESSSLSGTDAIAWHRLGDPSIKPDHPLSHSERAQQEEFYLLLSRRTEHYQSDHCPRHDSLLELTNSPVKQNMS